MEKEKRMRMRKTQDPSFALIDWELRKSGKLTKQRGKAQIFQTKISKISSIPNEQIIIITIGIYNSLLSNIKSFVQSPVNQNLEETNQLKKREQTAIIYNIAQQRLNAPTFTPKRYKDTIKEITNLVKQRITKVWEQLPQQEVKEYKQIQIKARTRHLSNPNNMKYYRPQMTAKDMFMLDVLGLFLLRNRQYIMCAKSMSSIIKKATLQTIFGQVLGHVFQSKQLYERIQYYKDWSTFSLQYAFSELISIISLIQLKYRICNNNSRYREYQQPKDTFQIQKFMFQVRLQDMQSKDNSSIKIFQYKFCELLFSFIGSNCQSRPKHIRVQIANALALIYREISQQKRKKGFLQIKYRYNIDINSLQQYYETIIFKEQENWQISLEKISKMPWLYVARDQVPIKMSQMHTYQQPKIIAADNLVFRTFYDTAKRNYQLFKNFLETTFSQEIIKGERRIFVQRISISYNQLALLKYKNRRKLLKNDMKMELILGMGSCGEFFLHFQRNGSSSYEFCRLLKSIINKKDYSFCTLVLAQQTKESNIGQQSFFDLYWYCLLELKSNLYFTPLITPFYLHQVFVSIVIKYLLKKDLSLQYFYKTVQIIADQVLAKFQKKCQPSLLEKLSSMKKRVRQHSK